MFNPYFRYVENKAYSGLVIQAAKLVTDRTIKLQSSQGPSAQPTTNISWEVQKCM